MAEGNDMKNDTTTITAEIEQITNDFRSAVRLAFGRSTQLET